jgi:hypothetical protein
MIATGFKRHGNSKTGDMIQVWILRSDIDPVTALHQGKNESVCGDCKHRPHSPKNPNGWGTCYVNVGQAVLQVYNAYKRGSYPQMSDYTAFNDRNVRIGAYGDPAAIPFDQLWAIIASAKRHTGYTHQWKKGDFNLRQYFMASVDSPSELKQAQDMGWRTFRVRTPTEEVQPFERVCPASDERGHIVQCATCMACHGGGNQKASIVIQSHGSWKTARFVTIRVLQDKHKGYRHLLPPSENAIKQRVSHVG